MKVWPLIERARGGDLRAWERLADLFLPRLLRRLRRFAKGAAEEAELLGEALFALARAVREFDPSRGVPFEGFLRSRLEGALWALARREAERRRREVPSSEVEEALSSLEGKQRGEEAALHKVDLERAFRELTEKERAVVVALFFEGRTESEVASSLGISQPQVSKLKRRALGRLREVLGEEYF